MPTIKLPIKDVWKNIDEISLTQNSTALINGYLDEAGSFNKIFGDELSIDLELGNVGIDASYYWEEKQLHIVICNGRLFKIDTNKLITEITGSGISFNIGTPVEFLFFNNATDGSKKLFMCNGGSIIYTDGSTLSKVTDSDATSNVDFISAIQGFVLLLPNNSDAILRSELDDPTNINATPYLMSDVSIIKSICKGESGDILLVSDRSYEKYYYSGSDAKFDKIQGSYGSIGIKAPKTLLYFNNGWQWLSNDKEFVRLQGSSLIAVECPFEKVIQEYSTVDDAYSFVAKPFGKKYCFTVFPTAKKILVQQFNKTPNSWFELNDWLEIGDWDLWYGFCYSYNPLWNEHLIGSRTHSKLYKINLDKYTHDGNTIRSLIRLGNFDYGIASKQKQIVSRVYTVLRGKVDMGDLTTDPKLLVRSRVNGSSEWETEREVKLGKIGDTLYQGFEYSDILGTPFYQRQEEIVISDDVPLILKEIEDEFNVEE